MYMQGTKTKSFAYQKVRSTMIEKGLYIQEKTPAIYIYQQIMDGRGQKGDRSKLQKWKRIRTVI